MHVKCMPGDMQMQQEHDENSTRFECTQLIDVLYCSQVVQH